jgi:hypothetical protein
MLEEQVAQGEMIPEVTSPQPEVTEHQSKADANFAEMRRRVHEAERRAQEAERLLQAQNQPQQPSLEEEDFNIDNEDYVQAKHVKTNAKKIHKKLSATEEKIQKLEEKLAYFEAKVDTDSLKDYTNIVNDDNVRLLSERYPEDYRSMMMNPNIKERARTAYNMIKNYGIAAVSPSVDAKISSNKLKPQSASLVAPQVPSTPLSRLNDYERRVLTEADRDRILQEVERKKMSW